MADLPIYMKVRVTESKGEKEACHPLIHCSNDCSNQSWIGLKSGTWSFFLISHRRAGAQALGLSSAAFQACQHGVTGTGASQVAALAAAPQRCPLERQFFPGTVQVITSSLCMTRSLPSSKHLLSFFFLFFFPVYVVVTVEEYKMKSLDRMIKGNYSQWHCLIWQTSNLILILI